MAWTDEMDDLAETVRDTFGVSVTLRRQTPGAFNTTTTIRAKTTSDTVLSAVRGPSRIEQIAPGETRDEVVVYTVKASDLAFRPDAGDHLIDGSVTRQVISASLSVDEAMYEITTKRPL